MDCSDPDLPGVADQLTDLEEEVHILRHKLDAATSRIMKLFRTADQITDSEIVTTIETIQDAIQWWINDVDQDMKRQSKDFRDSFQNILDNQTSLLCDLGYDNEFSHGASLKRLDWLGKHSTCIYFVLGRHIWIFLMDEIYSKRYPIGLSNDLKRAFDGILLVMESKNGDSDTALQAKRWKSNTISSLVRTELFQHDKETSQDDLFDKLAKSLGKWFNRQVLEPHLETLRTTVFQKAVNLHQEITCSSYTYTEHIPNLQVPNPTDSISDEAELSLWTLKDVTNWRPARDFGGVFYCLYSGMNKEEAPDEENVPVVPPVVLVYDKATARRDPQLQRSPRRSPQRSRRSSPEKRSEAVAKSAPPSTLSSRKGDNAITSRMRSVLGLAILDKKDKQSHSAGRIANSNEGSNPKYKASSSESQDEVPELSRRSGKSPKHTISKSKPRRRSSSSSGPLAADTPAPRPSAGYEEEPSRSSTYGGEYTRYIGDGEDLLPDDYYRSVHDPDDMRFIHRDSTR